MPDPLLLHQLRTAARFAKHKPRLGRPKHKPRLGRPKRWLPPDAAERWYLKQLLAVVDRVQAAVRAVLFPRGPGLVAEADRHRDAWDQDLDTLLAQVRFRLSQGPDDPELVAQQTAAQVSVWNQGQWREILRGALGVDVIAAEPWLGPQLRSWAKENAQLITTLEDDAVNQVALWTQRGVRQGWRWEQIAGAIEDRFDVSRSRARFIARDQVATLNGELTQARQSQAGVTEYTWQTSMDERVRGRPDGKYPDAKPSHWARQGKTFSWSQPPEGGAPGIAINCRCTAAPKLDNLLEGLK